MDESAVDSAWSTSTAHMGTMPALKKPTGTQRVPSGSDYPHFGLLNSSAEDRKRRWLALGFSPVLEVVVASGMFWALVSLPPAPLPQKTKEEVVYFQTVAPPTIKHPPKLLERPVLPKPTVSEPKVPKLRRQEPQKPPEMARLKVPEISQPKIVLPRTPHVPKPVEHFSSANVERPVPKKQIEMPKTGTFNPGSMAKATVKRPAREVQTGGFGADNGIPNDPSDDSHRQVAELGSFDLPSGPGHGNGTGGARGVRGTVASAGFGNGIGAGTGSRPNKATTQSVQQGGFGSVKAGAKPRSRKAAPEVAAFKPVVILSKPDPVYPPEARKLRIEGEVLLRVLFEANGSLRVLKVEQGLGHGMDEAAIHAAEHIQFKPAERKGQPVDSTALVHVIFQLAN